MSQHSDLPEMAFCVATLKLLIECASDAHHTALYVVRVRDSNDLCVCSCVAKSPHHNKLTASVCTVEACFMYHVFVRMPAWSTLGSALGYAAFGVVML
jgi:hypothetical protein